MSILPMEKNNESGQALLLVLLSMAVVLTVVLSIVSRSILDVAVTSGEEEAVRAFSAAEAGVERALIFGSSAADTDIGDAKFTTNVSGFASGETFFNYPIGIRSGESSVMWFISHDSNGDLTCSDSNCFTGSTMRLCWGKPGTDPNDAEAPAIELMVVYADTPGDYSTVQVGRVALDPNTTRIASNNFTDASVSECSIGGTTYAFQKTINFSDLGIPSNVYSTQNGLQYARATILYNQSAQTVGYDVNFGGNSPIPSQGLKIESTGSAGNSNRKLEVFQSHGEIPSIFDSAVFSSSGIVK